MQNEMENEGHGMPVHMAGVNEPGREAGNDTFTVGLGLPWLQDTAEEMAGGAWGAEHFDLVILDPDNVEVAVYNLIEYDLSDPANYDEIKRALAAVADRPRGASAMHGDAQHGAAGFGYMGTGADGMHDGMPHGAADMHPCMEEMEHDAAGVHGDTPESCPVVGASDANMPMHGTATHPHHP